MVTPSDIVAARPTPVTIATDGASHAVDALAVAWNGGNKIYVVTPVDIAGDGLEDFRAAFRRPDPGYTLHEPSELPGIWTKAHDESHDSFVGDMAFMRTWGLESLVEQGHDATVAVGPAAQRAPIDETLERDDSLDAQLENGRLPGNPADAPAPVDEWLERDDSLDAQLENGRLPEGPDDRPSAPPVVYHDSAEFPGFEEGAFDFDAPLDPPAPPEGARTRADLPPRSSDPHHDQSALSGWSHESSADKARRKAAEELESTGIAIDPDTGMTMTAEDDGPDL